MENTKAIFYTDGSCRPNNPGFIGYGIHGYVYEHNDVVESIEQYSLTDFGYHKNTNALLPNQRYVKALYYVDGFGSYPQLASNNYSELLAFKYLFKYLESICIKQSVILTDSEYAKNCILTWCKAWKKAGWKKGDGSVIPNVDLLKETYQIYEDLITKGYQIEIRWTQSHVGNLGNERADLLASIGSNCSQNKEIHDFKIKTTESRKMWKSDADKNPLLAFKRMYFNTQAEYHTPGRYYLCEAYDSSFIVGKPASSTCYSVVYTEPDPTIELVLNKQHQLSRDQNNIVLLQLDKLFSKGIYPWLEWVGENTICRRGKTHSLMLPDKTPVTTELNPTGLSIRALDHISMLEELLTTYIQYSETKESSYLKYHLYPIRLFDITDKIYDKTDKGHLLKTEHGVGSKNVLIEIDIEKDIYRVPFALGYDTLPRNQLKQIEKLNPEITLITWQIDEFIRYASIVKCGLGIGIWSNYYANQCLLKQIRI